jgi:hypothetical protein
MMQPMFPDGDWNVEMLNGGEALVVVAIELEVDAAVVAAVLEVDVASDMLAGCVTVTVF